MFVCMKWLLKETRLMDVQGFENCIIENTGKKMRKNPIKNHG